MKDAIGVAQNNLSTNSPNWDDIRLFGVVARVGSLRRASECLGMQAPTLSKRVEALEAALNIKLFERTTRGFTLTTPGRRILAHVEAIEMIMQRVAGQAYTEGQDTRREVKLMMSEGLADRWFIPNFLNLFLERQPNITIRLGTAPETGNTEVPPFDMQIQYGPAAQSNLHTVRVGTFHLMYFASQTYVDRYGMPKSQEDIANHRFADATPSLTAENGVMSTYSNIAGYSSASLISNSGLAMANAVQAGVVIALLPSYVYLTSPTFVQVLSNLHYKMGIYVNYSPTAAERPEVRAMLNFLKEIVFDRRRMPWFSNSFECPSEEWRTMFRGIMAAHNGMSVH